MLAHILRLRFLIVGVVVVLFGLVLVAACDDGDEGAAQETPEGTVEETVEATEEEDETPQAALDGR